MFGTSDPVVWLSYADRSYLACRLLYFTGLVLDAPVFAHRTMEFYLKAYLVSRGEVVKPGSSAWGHELVQLTEACAIHDSTFQNPELLRRTSYFQRYFQLIRYPTDLGNQVLDGTGVWFSFDSNIIPLDEVVAFARPRVAVSNQEWKESELWRLRGTANPRFEYQRRALEDQNSLLNIIVCSKTKPSEISFSSDFDFDLPGC